MKKIPKRIKVLIIEKNKVLREGLIAMTDGHNDIEILLMEGRSANLIKLIQKLMPDKIFMDLGTGDRGNITFLKRLKKRVFGIKTFVMGFGPSGNRTVKFKKAGADGFILKDAPDEEFLARIRS